MNKMKNRIGAVLAAILALPTIIEGSSVLLGISNPDQIVLKWLVVYNVTAAVFSLYVVWQIWTFAQNAGKLSLLMLAAHMSVFLILLLIFFSSGHVATKSLMAMGMRSSVWIVINLLLRSKS